MSAGNRFVIIANPRTGSNHLVSLLNSNPNITCFLEAFHQFEVYLLGDGKHGKKINRKMGGGTKDDLIKKRNSDPIKFLGELYNNSPTNTCGFKIFMDQSNAVLEYVLHNQSIKKIILFRANHLAVYSSEMIASADQHWVDQSNSFPESDRDIEKTTVKFDREHFVHRVNAYNDHYRNSIDVLNKTNQPYLFLTYEELNNESLFRRIFSYLGLDQPETLKTNMRKMNSNDILSRFSNPEDVRNYLKEIQRLDWIQQGGIYWDSSQN